MVRSLADRTFQLRPADAPPAGEGGTAPAPAEGEAANVRWDCDRAAGERPFKGRAELRALTFLEVRYGAISAKMQTAGTLPGNLPGNLRVPCTFRRGLIKKIRQKSGKIWAKSNEHLSNLAKFGEKISKIFSDFDENFEH